MSSEIIPASQFEYDIFEEAAPNDYHLPVILLLDTSSSMKGRAIDSLNAGVNRFIDEVSQNEDSRNKIDLAIIEFNSDVNVVQDFVQVPRANPVNLRAEGTTHMGDGIKQALQMFEGRRNFYKEFNMPIYRPWLFIVTDGYPTDTNSFKEALPMLRQLEQQGKYGHLKTIALGVEGADTKTLHKITDRVLKIDEADFTDTFNWLSKSMVLLSSVTGGGPEPNLPRLEGNVYRDLQDVSDF